MKKPYQELSLLDFQKRYQTEEDCEKRLFELRWPQGFICPACRHQEYYFIRERKLYQCKGCRHQTSLTAGTVMHGTRTPLLKWFWAIFLVSADKRGISALALSRRIEVSYWVAWTMLQKIRRGMRDRDSSYRLAGIIEMDDAFFGGPKEGGDRRGRGSSKTPVIVEASTNGKGIGYARMTVVERVDGGTIKGVLRADVKGNQVVKTDGLVAYHAVKQEGHTHHREIVKGRKSHRVLKWTHILISNAKSLILGTFHGVTRKHLQAYLDEFCYRFNRRGRELQLFDRLLTACINSRGACYAELTQ